MDGLGCVVLHDFLLLLLSGFFRFVRTEVGHLLRNIILARRRCECYYEDGAELP